VAANWLDINPGAITGYGGVGTDQGSGGVSSGMSGAAQTASGPTPPLWSPDNPLFWFGAFLAAASGFIFISTHVKVGPVSASASA
jgi:hypothetical protein